MIGVRGIRLVIAKRPLELDELTSGERVRYHQLVTAQRQDAWLRGRAALKTLLRHLGESPDTTALSFPHSRLSLTHSGTYAVAAGVAQHHPLEGIGVDLEIQHTMHPEAARFFLGEEEREWLTKLSGNVRARALLRLWTVKEAVFKADVDNDGRMFADYRLVVAGASDGVASVTNLCEVRSFYYASVEFQHGFLSIAVRQDRRVPHGQQAHGE